VKVSDEEVVENISGKSDKTFLYRGIEISPFEDKTAAQNITSPDNLAQEFSQVAGVARAFQTKTTSIPRKIDGIITSGKAWLLVMRVFCNGSEAWMRTETADIIDDPTGIDKVLAFRFSLDPNVPEL
jgi:hypothetical protein